MQLGEITIPMTLPCAAYRMEAIRALQLSAFRDLAASRPATFSTEGKPDWKAHPLFLKSLSRYPACGMLRLWSGIILTYVGFQSKPSNT